MPRRSNPIYHAAVLAAIVTLFLLAFLVLAGLAGCSRAAMLEYMREHRNAESGDHTREQWKLSNPTNADSPAVLNLNADGSQQGSVSGTRRPDTAIRQLWFLPWLGAGLVMLGAGTLVLRSWFPTVPLTASIGAIGTGGLFFFVPKVVQESWWVLPAGVGAVAVSYGVAWIDNWRKEKRGGRE